MPRPRSWPRTSATQQVSPQGAIAFVEQVWGRDLSGYDPDGPLPDVDPDVEGSDSITRGRVRHDEGPARRRGQVAGARRGEGPEHPRARHRDDRPVVVRRQRRRRWPTTIDDYVQDDAADGYILVPHLTPHGLDRFVDEVVPLLQERGVFRADYEGPTLRDHLGLPRPTPTDALPDCSPSTARRRAPLEVAIIGAGPTASSLLERLAANAARAARRDRRAADPPDRSAPRRHRPGVAARPAPAALDELDGRGRHDVHRRLGRSAKGPIRPGPSLHEWAHDVDDDTLRGARPRPSWSTRSAASTEMTFPTRRVQSVYLDWFHRQVVGVAARRASRSSCTRPRPSTCSTATTAASAIVLDGADEPLQVDVVVLSLGHLDAEPDDGGAALAAFAERPRARVRAAPGTPPSRTSRCSRPAPT